MKFLGKPSPKILADTPTTVPNPRLFNVTLIGSTSAGQIGGRLRGASRGYLRNFWPGELKWQGQTGDEFIAKRIESLLAEEK